MNVFILLTLMSIGTIVSTAAVAEDYTHNTPGLSGYEPVAYFTDGGRPLTLGALHATRRSSGYGWWYDGL